MYTKLNAYILHCIIIIFFCMYIYRIEENMFTGFKRIFFVLLVVCLLLVSTGGTVSAAEYEKTTTHS